MTGHEPLRALRISLSELVSVTQFLVSVLISCASRTCPGTPVLLLALGCDDRK